MTALHRHDLARLRPAAPGRPAKPALHIAIAREIAALRAGNPADADFRREVVECLRRHLDSGRAAARVLLDSGDKRETAQHHMCALEDELIRAIHAYAVTYVYPLENPSNAERLAIVAVGGYGRGALAPGSDIDLLFLLPYKQTPWGESVVETILYVLWDLRQKVGHATRSIDECLRQAKADITIRTTLLEARLILGDSGLFAELGKRFDTEIVAKTAPAFVAAKLAERDARLNKSGVSRYVVEPNVKEGKGGLRDLNTLFWIARYVYRVKEARALVAAGLFTKRELELFQRCEAFLWRVRCHLHFLTGRAEDRLTFDVQRAIADRLGYHARSGLSAVERFMKHYFLVAKDVGDLTAIVCAALEERETKPATAINRFMTRFRRRPLTIAKGAFAIEAERITIAAKNVFDRDPVNLIRLFYEADRTGLAIHPDATRAVTLSLKRIDASLRNDPEANRLFVEILTSRNAPEIVLRRMNEAGVLGRFIPDFGRVVAMMQFNMYHHYTVDEHLLRTVGVLAEIDAGRLKEEHPVANEIMPGVTHRRALFVACFLHDVAKGREGDHSIEGAEVARRLCPRFGLSAVETETVGWLIEQHLTMSTVAQSRDLSDPRTIQTFAGVVQTLERLKLLLVLTVCDIRAVGPGVWNGWKGQLLRTLYWETEVVLAGGHSAIDRKQRVARLQDELHHALPELADHEFAAYAARHYPAYWLKVDLKHKLAHVRLLRAAAAQMRSLASEVATDAFRGMTELTILAPDHPRLLSIIAGACAMAGANIVDAQIFTTNDGLALDTVTISRAFDRDEDELRRAGRIAESIEKALRGQIHLSDKVAARGGAAAREKTFQVAPDVIIDNTLSNRDTVLEVSGLDRPGLLYDLTRVLSNLNLNINSAHIATFGEKAVDVFYVTDLTGAQVVNPSRQGAIRRRLLEALAPST